MLCNQLSYKQEPVLEMILRQDSPQKILEALCFEVGAAQPDRQVAFFLLADELWKLAATGDLTSASLAVVSSIAPEQLSESLFDPDKSDSSNRYFARHLFSGIGELMGIFICLEPEENLAPVRTELLDSACRLAVLAIEQRNLLEELTWQAGHDALTGLFTRTHFERLLSRRMQLADCALLCVNLDRFRLVNDVLGHSLGNLVLMQFADRFHACLPPNGILARLGGDEFAALIDSQDAEPTTERLIGTLTEPFSIEDNQLFIGASVGISSTQPGSTPESLQREAFIALYHAKQSAKQAGGRAVHFEESMAAIPPQRLQMEMCLRSALAKNEMEVHYQAQVQLSTGLICGAEALMRWNPRGLGSIAPSAFIPILEETGLILEFGRWILQRACQQGIEWRRQTGVLLRLAVNVSAAQLLGKGFIQDVESILHSTGLPPGSLELELTESLFVGDFDEARSICEKLRSLGVLLAIDDFGTGQSSLSYLHELPFQRLKIDQSFVKALCGDEKSRPLLENIIRLAGGMNMTTIAEGVETAEQLEVLQSMGCHEGQGYLFAKPLPAGEFLTHWLDYTASVAQQGRRLNSHEHG